MHAQETLSELEVGGDLVEELHEHEADFVDEDEYEFFEETFEGEGDSGEGAGGGEEQGCYQAV